MLAFAQAGKGHLIASNLEAGNRNLRAYATQQGKDRVLLTLINKEGTSHAVVSVECAAAIKKGSILRLSGPSLESRTGVLLGGVAIEPSGVWHPGPAEEIHASGGKLIVRLPAASAAVVTVHV